jgi:hypothetical protein
VRFKGHLGSLVKARAARIAQPPNRPSPTKPAVGLTGVLLLKGLGIVNQPAVRGVDASPSALGMGLRVLGGLRVGVAVDLAVLRVAGQAGKGELVAAHAIFALVYCGVVLAPGGGVATLKGVAFARAPVFLPFLVSVAFATGCSRCPGAGVATAGEG